MQKRKTIGKKLRFDVFKRDGFECQYCGANPTTSPLQVDHIHPVKEGGDNSIDNLVTSCQPCNIGKGAGLLSNIPDSLKDKAKGIKDHEKQITAYGEIMRAKKERIHSEAWEVGDMFTEHYGDEETGIRKTYLTSIKNFNDRLGVFEVMDAMEIALGQCFHNKHHAFKYFCGICWNKVKANNDGESDATS